MINNRKIPKTWLITDTHFYHNKIIELVNRPINYQDLIINNWNNIVLPIDIIIHLGDVIFYNYNKLNSILNNLPGKKILTIGNHDHKTKSWYLNNGFNFVCDYFCIDNIIFSHDRFIQPYDYVNIHGHYHTYINEYNSKYRLLSIEFEHYKPVELFKFLKKSNTKNYYTNNHA